MMKLLLLTVLCLLFSVNDTIFAQNKPNVLIIYTDDQGAIDVNCYGAKDLLTPNLDNFSKEGLMFTQAYVAAPICTPSRAALLTGRTPQRAQMPGNTSSQPGKAGMPTEQFTIAEAFKEQGYRTAHFGKWHLGFTEETMPNAQGFDHSFGHMGGCIDNYSHTFYWSGPNRHDLWRNGEEVFYEGTYFPELMYDEFKTFLSTDHKEPFFAYYALNLPHYPVQPLEKWREYYKDLDQPRRDYAAFMSTVDEYVGKVMALLEEKGLMDNTIIVYQSDHGHSTSQRNFSGGGDAGPYRGAKGNLFEGGIRVPTFIQWNNHIPKGEIREGMLVNVDWFPTLLDLCGFTFNQEEIDGLSLKNMILNNEQTPRKEFQWKFNTQWVQREGDWKLLGNPKDNTNKKELRRGDDAFYLVNLKEDPSELNNLSKEHPEIVQRLKDKYMEWEFAEEIDLEGDYDFYNHKGINAKVISNSTIYPSYKENLKKWNDGYKGSRTFSDGCWIAYLEEDLEVTLDLGEVKPLDSITVGFLQDHDNSILLPDNVIAYYKHKGKWEIFDEKSIEANKFEMTAKRKEIQLSVEDTIETQFIRIKAKNLNKCPEWHFGAGSAVFIFSDEIILQ